MTLLFQQKFPKNCSELVPTCRENQFSLWLLRIVCLTCPDLSGYRTHVNRTVLGRHRGVRGEGIKSQKCASVPAYQQFSKIYTCARACIYGNCRHAGTLVHPSVGGEAGCDCGRVSKQYSVHLETYFFLLFLRNYLRISFFCCIFAESFFDCACAPCYEFHV